MNKELGFDDVIYKDGELIQIKDDPIFGIGRSGGFLDDATDFTKITATNNAGRSVMKIDSKGNLTDDLTIWNRWKNYQI